MSSNCVIYSRAVLSAPRVTLARQITSTALYTHHQFRQRSSRNSIRTRTRVGAEDSSKEPDEEIKSDDYVEMPSNEPTFFGKLFGSYLQLAVWIVTLSFAGYKGIQLAQTDPSSVGLLIAPPAGALFLIITFLWYRFGSKKD